MKIKKTFKVVRLTSIIIFAAKVYADSDSFYKNQIGGIDFNELLEHHHYEVEKFYLNTWIRDNIDYENKTSHILYWNDGEPFKENFNTYHLGRALWLFSYLYNHFGNNDQHLQLATTTKNFLFTHMLRDDDMFVEEVSRNGEVVHNTPNIFGDIYIFQGLAEFYRATGDLMAHEQAIKTAITVGERATSPVYMHNYINHGRAAARAGEASELGLQRLSAWQHYLGALTKTLRIIHDVRLEAFADIALDKILNVHFNQEHGFAWEILPFDGNVPDELSRFGTASNFHAIQAAWMAMDEGIRRGDNSIIQRALLLGNHYYESLFQRSSEKVGGYTDDLLVFLMMGYLNVKHEIAADWFGWRFRRVWEVGINNPSWNRSCLLHHPRRLFMIISMLEKTQSDYR